MHLFAVTFKRSQSFLHLLSIVLALLAFTCLCPLLYFEHTRSIRPADSIVTFLLVSLACDIWVFVSSGQPLGAAAHSLAAPNILLKLLLAVTESRGKASILRSEYSKNPPSQLGGLLNRTFFWWVNSILAAGNHKILGEEDLPPLDEHLSSKRLRQRALHAWEKRGQQANHHAPI